VLFLGFLYNNFYFNLERKREAAMSDCLFCKIIEGKIPSKKVYEDEQTFAFEDINPQAPTHVLIVPKRHIVDLKDAKPEDAELIGYCHLVAAKIARQCNIENGYRTVYNVGPGAGQTVFHLHLHLLGGRMLVWPPG
jgi:histidine triad (HIT) family protein